MNWRIVVAVGVTFVVGAAAGGFAEHERVQKDKPNKAAAGTTTTTRAGTPAAPANWFGTKKADACPALKRWNTAAAAAYASALDSKAWSAKSTTIQTQTSAMGSAFRDLGKLANPAGKAELAFLVTYVGKLNAEAKKAKSQPAYAQAQTALASARVKRDLAIVGQANGGCQKS